MVSRYGMVIPWSAEDEVYVVSFPEFPSAHTHGACTKKRPGTGKKFLSFCFDPTSKCIVLCLSRRALRMLGGEADESVAVLYEQVLAYQQPAEPDHQVG